MTSELTNPTVMHQACVGYGLIIKPLGMNLINDALVSELGEDAVRKHHASEEAYDPQNPLKNADSLLGLYYELLREKYPNLSISPFRNQQWTPDGYAVFITESLRLIDEVSDFDLPSAPSQEELAELEKFRSKFAPNSRVGWKQWVSIVVF